MPAEEPTPQSIARAVTEASERASLLVREEIELAKAEVAARVSKLIKGAIVGATAGVFAIVGLLFLLHSASWGAWQIIGWGTNYWLGYLIVAVILFVLGALAGALAYKAVKAGSPPKPDMAIDEAKKIRETVSGSGAAAGAGATAAAGAATEPPATSSSSIASTRGES